MLAGLSSTIRILAISVHPPRFGPERFDLRQTEWQPNGETRALPHRAGHGDPTAVEFREQLDHDQSEPGAFILSRQPAVDLTERFEQVREAVCRDADPAVGDAD